MTCEDCVYFKSEEKKKLIGAGMMLSRTTIIVSRRYIKPKKQKRDSKDIACKRIVKK